MEVDLEACLVVDLGCECEVHLGNYPDSDVHHGEVVDLGDTLGCEWEVHLEDDRDVHLEVVDLEDDLGSNLDVFAKGSHTGLHTLLGDHIVYTRYWITHKTWPITVTVTRIESICNYWRWGCT